MIRLELGYGPGAGRRRRTAADRAVKGLAARSPPRSASCCPRSASRTTWRWSQQLRGPHQGDRGRTRRASPDHAPGDDPRGGLPDLPGEQTAEPAFGLPARWIDPAAKEEAIFRGCTVVDPPSVLTTHLTELVRETMAELLSYAETQKLLDELPREQQKLVGDLIPSQIGAAGCSACCRRCSPSVSRSATCRPSSKAMQEACGGSRAIPSSSRMCAPGSPGRSASACGPGGYVPLITLSPDWELAFAERLVGPPEDRQLAMAPTRLQEFMQRLRDAFDAAAAGGEAPVLLPRGAIRVPRPGDRRAHPPGTPVLARRRSSRAPASAPWAAWSRRDAETPASHPR